MKFCKILVIDDKPELASQAKEEIEYAFEDDVEITVEVLVEYDFDSGYERVRNGDCDLVILDVRRDAVDDSPDDNDAGRNVFSHIQAVRFLPVIFWTAVPRQVEDMVMEPLVFVFQKDKLEYVPDAIRAAIRSKSIETMANIERQVADTMRKHMWQELAPNWQEDTAGGNPEELSRILITRVAQSLQDQEFPELTSKPSHCYLYPPVSKTFRPGDLFRILDGGEVSWWSLMTPACDLAQKKAEFVLLARASTLSSFAKFEKWNNSIGTSKANTNWDSLSRVLKGDQARYHYLPEFREIPELLLDLENIKSIPFKDLDQADRIASLVNPYSEALLAKNSHFRGRIGVPDLNTQFVRDKLTASD